MTTTRAIVATLAALVACALVPHHAAPLGVRLQRDAGNRYEVLYNPTTGVYSVEPKP